MIGKAGYLDYFEPVLLSHPLKEEKPNHKAYKLVLKQLALPAQECLFIDDRPENIQAALESGMDAILFRESDPTGRGIVHNGASSPCSLDSKASRSMLAS